MIVFDLRCAPVGHVFEAWFASSSAFDEQKGRGLVACPLCGSADVAKAPMAPAVGAKGNAARTSAPAESLLGGAPEEVKTMLAAAAALQKKLLAGSESVGPRFAAEARAIHLGESDPRPIHGEATRTEAEALIEEGVPIAPCHFRQGIRSKRIENESRAAELSENRAALRPIVLPCRARGSRMGRRT